MYLGQAKLFSEKCLKLQGGPLPKRYMHTNFYRIPAMFDHASEALNLTILAKIALKQVLSEPPRRGQTLPEFDKNWCALTFWPKVPRGV